MRTICSSRVLWAAAVLVSLATPTLGGRVEPTRPGLRRELSTELPAESPAARTRDATWTVALYICGDNNLEPCAIGTMNALELIGSDSNVNIVVQIDRIPGHDTTNGDWTNTRRYYVTWDSNTAAITSLLLQDMPEQNMGSPETLSDFGTWAFTSYPADHCILILWDHGDGGRSGLRGSCHDETSGNDGISVRDGELEQALAEIEASLGRPLDILGIAACMEGVMETCQAGAGLAGYLIGSECSIWDVGPNNPTGIPQAGPWPFNSWLYELCVTYGGEMTPQQLCESITWWYQYYWVTYGTPGLRWSITALDLTQWSPVPGALDALALAMASSWGAQGGIINSARLATPTVNVDDSGLPPGSCPNVDLFGYLANLYSAGVTGDLLSSVLTLNDAAGDAVMYSYGWNPVAGLMYHGLAMYHPWPGLTFTQYEPGYGACTLADLTYWDEFVSFMPDLVIDSVVPSDATPDTGDSITAEVTVRNRGAWPSVPAYVDFFFDPPSAPQPGDVGDVWALIPALNPGAAYVWTTPPFTGSLTAMWQSFALVDGDLISCNDEVHEDNNSYGPVAIEWGDTPVEASLYALETQIGSVMVRWVAQTLPGVESLNLYRATDAGGPFVRVNLEPLPVASPGQFEDSTVWPGTTFWYELRAVYFDGSEGLVSDMPAYVTTGGELVARLRSVYPNPSTDHVQILLDLPAGESAARLSVHDVAGRVVRSLTTDTLHQGRHLVEWDGLDDAGFRAAPGIYFLRLKVGEASDHKKIVMIY